MHTVKQGEDMISIAAEYAVVDWKQIYDHVVNQRLKKFRPNPMLLHPGDIVYIPDLSPIVHKFQTNQKHTIVIEIPKTKVMLNLLDDDGIPISNVDYELTVGDRIIYGKTDNSGLVEGEIPFGQSEVTLTVRPDPDNKDYVQEYDVEIGTLDPVEEVSGIQGLLQNLGYDCGAVDDDFGNVTSDTIRQFQSDYGLEETGNLDEQTLNKLHNPDLS